MDEQNVHENIRCQKDLERFQVWGGASTSVFKCVIQEGEIKKPLRFFCGKVLLDTQLQFGDLQPADFLMP